MKHWRIVRKYVNNQENVAKSMVSQKMNLFKIAKWSILFTR